jgi:hypothetical protein
LPHHHARGRLPFSPLMILPSIHWYFGCHKVLLQEVCMVFMSCGSD